MTQTLLLSLSLAWGGFIGMIFFGGLWLTVKAIPTSRRPHLLWAVSLVLRLAALLAGLIPLLRFGPWAFVMGAAGALLMRLALARILAPEIAAAPGSD